MTQIDRQAVLAAISEFNELGRAPFMEKYGFADRNITYEIELDGERFPSKAIYGAACGKVVGGTARTSATCDGTEAREGLAKLGFNIISQRQMPEPEGDADRIRRHAIEDYIDPARQRGQASVIIRSRDINEKLALKGHWRNIWQALRGEKLQKIANLSPPRQVGPDESSTTEFRFDLSGSTSGWVEGELRRRYGEPITDTDKLLAFALDDGKQVAWERNLRRAQIWIEADPPVGIVAADAVQRYEARQPRHSNLPPRLSHTVKEGEMPRPVSKVIVESAVLLARLLDGYEASSRARLNRNALEALRSLFLKKYPTFQTFADNGNYGANEDLYKRALIARSVAIMDAHQGSNDAALGGAMLDLVAGNGGLESNLLDWRVAKLVSEIRTAEPGRIEAAAGRLLRADNAVQGVGSFVEDIWPLLWPKAPAKPYAESRTIPTMLRALIDPAEMLGIRTTPTDNAAKMLLGRAAFAPQPLTVDELKGVLALAEAIFDVMKAEWHWEPRDLWDVQGFLWETCQKRLPEIADLAQPDPVEEQPMPTNLILYGPPGTGKTFATAAEAVRLCGERVPEDRKELMRAYRTLCDAGQIEFVTFHQSYSYEDFVEGLRPSIGDGGENDDVGPEAPSSSFRLVVHDGVFKRASEAARLDGGSDDAERLDRTRRVFKIALGQRGIQENQIEDGLRNNLIHLGWGGDIDWSDERFDSFESILEKWRREKEPDAGGKNANIEQSWSFRADMQVGDYVVLSDGRDRFRAVGRIAGEYYFDTDAPYHPHRRSVDWLWTDKEGVAREEFYPNFFRRQSAYRLNQKVVDWDALDRIVYGATSPNPANARPHVLIIDEINRANISKVFGELITLIEPDKRLGLKNALTLTLPYSKKAFGVPANLHIVGTMNTADRSIALLDTALRRRFTFREIAPQPKLLKTVDGVDLAAVLATINDRIEYLIDREHRIGHAFFMGDGGSTLAAINATMRDKVIPLLQEYFFEDWSRIHAVLGDGFIGQRRLLAPPGIEGDERASWFVQPDFDDKAYRQLVKGASVSEPPAANDEMEPDADAAE